LNFIESLLFSRQTIHELKDELEQSHERSVDDLKNEVRSKQENQQLQDLQVKNFNCFSEHCGSTIMYAWGGLNYKILSMMSILCPLRYCTDIVIVQLWFDIER
jgi:predicted metal-binding protein